MRKIFALILAYILLVTPAFAWRNTYPWSGNSSGWGEWNGESGPWGGLSQTTDTEFDFDTLTTGTGYPCTIASGSDPTVTWTGDGNTINSGTLTVGYTYKITGQTDGDFTVCGSADSNVNTFFTATTTCSGVLDAGDTVELAHTHASGDPVAISASGENLGAEIATGTTTTGSVYEITAQDGTDFTNYGSSSNDVGTIFTATGEAPLDANDKVKFVVETEGLHATVILNDPPNTGNLSGIDTSDGRSALGSEVVPDPTCATDWMSLLGSFTHDAGNSEYDCAGGSSDMYYYAGDDKIVRNHAYECTYTIQNYSGGTVKIGLGGYEWGTTRSANGTYTEVVTPINPLQNTRIYLRPSSFTGSVTNISVKPYQFSAYTHPSTFTNLTAGSYIRPETTLDSAERITSGTLTVGNIYFISKYTDQDFTADGASSNARGQFFTATGTNVTLDANNSVILISDIVAAWDGGQSSTATLTKTASALRGEKYEVEADYTRTAGTVTPYVGSTAGEDHTTTETVTSGDYITVGVEGDGDFKFQGSSTFDGTVDDATFKKYD